ncbi:signal peptidase 22kDa subunit [Powellomyces hirtus]|nr:signal peptidase 22kDa subunit [Powellomyces hirtus]
MYSLPQRANTLFAFFISVLFCVLGAVALSGPVLLLATHAGGPDAGGPVISVEKMAVKLGRRGHYYDYTQPMTELAFIHFNMVADLTPYWTWNTKQLFVYVVAEYATPTHPTNQIVIYDDIITSKDDAEIDLRNQLSEYMASDMSHKLAGINATLSLHWNTMPHVGILMADRKGSTPLVFPKATK